MYILIRALITFVVVLLVLYLVNMLPIDGRAKQMCASLSSSLACCRCSAI